MRAVAPHAISASDFDWGDDIASSPSSCPAPSTVSFPSHEASRPSHEASRPSHEASRPSLIPDEDYLKRMESRLNRLRSGALIGNGRGQSEAEMKLLALEMSASNAKAFRASSNSTNSSSSTAAASPLATSSFDSKTSESISLLLDREDTFDGTSMYLTGSSSAFHSKAATTTSSPPRAEGMRKQSAQIESPPPLSSTQKGEKGSAPIVSSLHGRKAGDEEGKGNEEDSAPLFAPSSVPLYSRSVSSFFAHIIANCLSGCSQWCCRCPCGNGADRLD